MSPIFDDNCEFYIMKSSPTVISVGKRCLHYGYYFIWLPGKQPVMVMPTKQIVLLDVENNIPYLREDGLHVRHRDPTSIYDLSGVWIDKDGSVQIGTFSKSPAAAAAPRDPEPCLVPRPKLMRSTSCQVSWGDHVGHVDSMGGCTEEEQQGMRDICDEGITHVDAAPVPLKRPSKKSDGISDDVIEEPECMLGHESHDMSDDIEDAEEQNETTIGVNRTEEIVQAPPLHRYSPQSRHQAQVHLDPSLLVGPLSIRHQCTHKPADPHHCETCRIALARQVRRFAGAFKRHLENYGDIITLDHVKMVDWMNQPGITGKHDALNTLDLKTRFKTSDAVNSKNTLQTYTLLNHIRGNDYIHIIYSDGWKAFTKAAQMLNIPHEKSQPGQPQTNAIMERCNQDILRGTRAVLYGAGLPTCFWPYASACYCMLDNIAEPENDPMWEFMRSLAPDEEDQANGPPEDPGNLLSNQEVAVPCVMRIQDDETTVRNHRTHDHTDGGNDVTIDISLTHKKDEKSMYDEADIQWYNYVKDGLKELKELIARYHQAEVQENIKLKVKRLVCDAKLPQQAHDGDAGLDLCTTETFILKPTQRYLFPTGLAVQIPYGTYGHMAGRSGLAAKKGIQVLGGVVDYGYTGEVKVILLNTGHEDVQIMKGYKIAQMIIEKINANIDIQEVDQLNVSTPFPVRGQSGFGSTDTLKSPACVADSKKKRRKKLQPDVIVPAYTENQVHQMVETEDPVLDSQQFADQDEELKKSSAYYRKHKVKFHGQVIPFGCGVFYMPAPTIATQPKAAPGLWCVSRV